jgi:ABC-type transporter MlaC component
MLEKVGLKDRLFHELLEFFCNVVTQQYKNITLTDTAQPARVADTSTLTNDMTAILIAIVTSATENPIEVSYMIDSMIDSTL